jgi:L-amino acid N-acyltransferase YncA
MNFTIDDMEKHDWKQVRKIYREGLATGLAAFMLDPPIWKVWDTTHLIVGRLVARTDNAAIVGWSALAPAPDT